MKKPVIIVIALIYILAIVVVGFLGIPSRVYNPETFVQDINLVFDDKLVEIPASEEVPYRFRISSSEAVTFNITAKVVPNEATQKKVIFEKRDDLDESIYTYSIDYNENSGYNIATYEVAPVPSGSIRVISIKVRPTDGNKLLYKMIDIYVMNL